MIFLFSCLNVCFREIARFIVKHMEDVGAEAYYHKLRSDNLQFSPLGFFSSACTMELKNSSDCTLIGVSSVGIIRAPRGDGKESIVLVTPYNPETLKSNEALSLGLAYSVFSLLSRVVWLAKDIVWLAADSRHGEYASVASWLEEYHNPVFSRDSRSIESTYGVFRRAGTMAAALVVKVMDKSERKERDRLDIHAEASNGQMPNLDLINIVHFLAVHRQGLHVKVGAFRFLENSALLKHLGETLLSLVKLAQRLNPGWKVDINSADFVDGSATLASSMYYQVIMLFFKLPCLNKNANYLLFLHHHKALGVPTGPHGAFRDFQIDAITMEFSPRTQLTSENGVSSFLLRSGRFVSTIVLVYFLF